MSGPIVVTGLGAYTAFGAGWDAVRSALDEDRSAALPAEAPEWIGLTIASAPEPHEFSAQFPKVRRPLPSRTTRIVMLAVREALADARLDPAEHSIGLMLNRNCGAALGVAKALAPMRAGGIRKLSPLAFAHGLANTPAITTAQHCDLRGPVLQTIGGGALALALDALRAGRARAIVAGGFEELEVHTARAGASRGHWHVLDAHGDVAAVPGEGAVCFVLEPRAAAEARGATIYAELASVCSSLEASGDEGADGVRRSGPTGAEMSVVWSAALAEARADHAEVTLVIGNAAGLPSIDAAERDALAASQLGTQLRTLKRHLGEAGGMSLAASLAYAADCVRRGVVHRATIGARTGTESLPSGIALVSALELQGQHTVAVLRGV